MRAGRGGENIASAKQLSLSLLYWLQTKAPRPDGGEGGRVSYAPILSARRTGWRSIAPHPGEPADSREFTVCEQHVGVDARAKCKNCRRRKVVAEYYPDSVGIGSYRIDLHPSTGGDNYIDIASLPFQIPLGAFLPDAWRIFAGVQEPRRDAHHEWLLPPASRGMEHRRSRGCIGGVLRDEETRAARSAG